MKGKFISLLTALYCVLMPLEEALSFSFGSILKPLGILIIITSLISYPFPFERVMKFYWPLLLWLLYMMASIFWVSSEQYWKDFMAIYVGQVALVISMESVSVKEFRIDLLRIGLILAGILSSFVLVYFPTVSMITEEGRRSVVLFGNPIDPNIIAAEIMIAIHLCTDSILRGKKIIKNVFLGLIIVFLFYGMLLTGSRGGLIALVVGWISMFWMLARQKGNAKNIFRILVISGIAVLIILPLLPDSLIESRFTSETILGRNELQDGSHNRYTIWRHAMTLILQNPIFGYGCGNFMAEIGKIYRVCASHNLYILLMVEGGIIGLSLFMSYLFRIVKGLLQRRTLYTEFALVLSLLVMALSLDSITFKYFWIVLIYARLCSRHYDANYQ